VTARPADDLAPRPRPRPGAPLVRPEPDRTAPVVSAAGSAIVSVARMGRLLGRSGWRIAKQLPGVSAVEQQAQRLRQAAAAELTRLLDGPQRQFAAAGPEDQRVMMLVQNAGTDPEPLRTAMSELLDRSAGSTGRTSREYLFGTIVSQLVPDEARILGTLAEGRPFPVLDVVAKQVGRSSTRLVLGHVTRVGDAAGVALKENTATYLTRLHGFGLVEFASAGDELAAAFEALANAAEVTAAKRRIEQAKLGSPKLVRKTVALSALGREFWSACAPTHGA
jgi:hypothetical protein